MILALYWNNVFRCHYKGLEFFINKECVTCHQGVNLGGQTYHPFGVIEKPGASVLPPDDKGRFAVTKTASDEYVFRGSPLRNVAITAAAVPHQ
jgi:cytochrome c peroxidase